MFWVMGNNFGPFPEDPDQTEGQEQGGGAVGSQEVTQLLTMLETWFWCQNQCFGAWGII